MPIGYLISTLLIAVCTFVALAPPRASGPWPFSAPENQVTRDALGKGFRMNPQPNGAETVDQDEVARFSRLAGEWWDPHGPMATLHKFNPVRLRGRHPV